MAFTSKIPTGGKTPRVLAQLGRVTEFKPVPKDPTVSIATVMGYPCAVASKTTKIGDSAILIGVDTFIPRTDDDKVAFLFDKAINPYHAADSQMAIDPTTPRMLSQGLRIKPTLIAGQLSSGLAIIITAHTIVQDTLKHLGLHPRLIGTSEASNTLSTAFKLHEWRQTVAFERVLDRPEFIPDPTVNDIDTMNALLQGAPGQIRFYVTTPPPDPSAMIVYFLRNDSQMARSIEHRETRDRDIEAKRQRKVAAIGRVGVCSNRFDHLEM